MNRRDETLNHELARSIVDRGDMIAVNELVDNLSNMNRNIQSDCIKVLYEIGERKPGLISDKAKEFVGLLGSENSRLVWGAMTALDSIALENPEAIHAALPTIVRVSNLGSVIARDHAVSILIKMATLRKYKKAAFKLLIDQLKNCPTNQLPM
jgi:HEAT repeat protein